ncbi:unnamed protein product [Echinostoma caproni]|uniref:N-acetylgalactosaminide beta-1,3-galactosyltransferase n=1 Tax=Echinostoma caproni TaxID=27848 RepID=A0A183ALV0_9TREM|nr:unnamed protein product [Echinostoma caproni]
MMIMMTTFPLHSHFFSAAVPFESRDLLWNKTHFALNYISALYGEKFDYFFKADDDTYVVVENLRKLLSTYNPEVPFLMGFKHDVSCPRLKRAGVCVCSSITSLPFQCVNPICTMPWCSKIQILISSCSKDNVSFCLSSYSGLLIY